MGERVCSEGGRTIGCCRRFRTGDYLKLIITGKAVDNTTTSLDYYLADYTSKKEADHYCLDTWQWVDLRPLGKVKAVSFRMEGTKQNSYGLTTPTYFCMDDFNGYREVKQGAKQDVDFEETVINLAQFLPLMMPMLLLTIRSKNRLMMK